MTEETEMDDQTEVLVYEENCLSNRERERDSITTDTKECERCISSKKRTDFGMEELKKMDMDMGDVEVECQSLMEAP